MVAVVVAFSLVGGVGQSPAAVVDLELSLVIDTSGSVSSSEYALQMGGYKAAFESSIIQNLIVDGGFSMAVNVIQFGTTASELVGWHLIDSAASADTFAAAIGTVGSGSGWTDIAEGIDLASSLMAGNAYEGDRLVIDVSGDGPQNQPDGPAGGGDPDNLAAIHDARDAAVGDGITINGLAILTDVATLDVYYTNHVIGGGEGL